MNNFTDFNDDLAKFAPYEDILAQKLINHFDLKPPTYSKSNDNKFDIILSNNATYELKCDTIANQSKNVFVEHYSRGKPSGISTSKADFYVFCFGNEKFYVIHSFKKTEAFNYHQFCFLPYFTNKKIKNFRLFGSH